VHFAVAGIELADFLQLLEAAHEGGRMNAKDARGVRFILSRGMKHILNVVVFQFSQRDELIACRRDIVARQRFGLRKRCFVIAQFLGKVGFLDLRFLAENHGALDYVA